MYYLLLFSDHCATSIQEEAKAGVQSIEAFVGEARDLLERREFDDSIARLETALEISPADEDVLIDLYASDDLETWTLLVSNVALSGIDEYQYIDNDSLTKSKRFYKMLIKQP